MTEWTVWRQDDNGNPYRVAAVGDRVGALARVLELESGHPHKQLYWAAAPPSPAAGRTATSTSGFSTRAGG